MAIISWWWWWFALQSQDFMTSISALQVELDYTQIIWPKKLPSGGSHHLNKRLSKWSPLLHNISKDNCCRPRIVIINNFYRTRVRSLEMLVTNSLTNWLTHWLLFSKLDWCDPGVWRCLLKTCWSCYCCWCWWWGSCWQQFVADLEAEVWS